MRVLVLAVAATLMLPLAAEAQNVALVLTNDDYDRFPDVRSANSAQAASRALAEAGFEVTEVRDARHRAAAAALSDFRRDLAEAERVVVLLAGHVVNDGDRSWLLTTEAERPDAFSVGAQGLPLAPVLAMLSDHQGNSVVLVADVGENLRLGPGLASGFAPAHPPQGVTLFVGSARGILSVLRGDLLEPGRTLAETAANLPASVEAYGFLPRTIAFLSGEAPTASVPQALVEPDPRERAETVEAQLQLDRDERRSVQRDLELLGYDPRGIDGIFGPGTRAAIRNWQDQNDFDPTGYLSGNQIALLQEQGARRARQLEAEAVARQAEQDRLDTAYWGESGATGTEAGLRAYLERFPDGLFAERARQLLEPFDEARREQAARADRQSWDSAREQDTLAGYREYLDRFPDGAFRREAQARMDALTPESSAADAQAEESRVAGSVLVRLFVEQRLQQLGADPGRIDGVFDEETRRAIRRFQRARDLPVTGYVTQATMARLLAG
jgi:peptidoglycan hydrolase-like protein with peptidoglycan-binding domain